MELWNISVSYGAIKVDSYRRGEADLNHEVKRIYSLKGALRLSQHYVRGSLHVDHTKRDVARHRPATDREKVRVTSIQQDEYIERQKKEMK